MNTTARRSLAPACALVAFVGLGAGIAFQGAGSSPVAWIGLGLAYAGLIFVAARLGKNTARTTGLGSRRPWLADLPNPT